MTWTYSCATDKGFRAADLALLALLQSIVTSFKTNVEPDLIASSKVCVVVAGNCVLFEDLKLKRNLLIQMFKKG